MVVAGENIDNIKMHPFNPEGNVNFNSKSINKSTDEKGQITLFFSLLLLFFTLPNAISQLTNMKMIGGLFELVILFFIIKYISVISIIINRIFSPKDKNSIKIISNDISKNYIEFK